MAGVDLFSKVKRAYLISVSFFAGFVLMTLELVSSRLVAPLVGSSIYTWTTIIGVTLLGLSIGSICGGRLADTGKVVKKMFIVLVCGSLTVAAIPLLSQLIENQLSFSLSLGVTMIIVAMTLFLVPTIFIGMIQPLVIKQYTLDMKHLGRQYGLLSGVWSAGSILGVFLTGFVLVAWLGTAMLLFVLAGCLFIVATGWVLLYKATPGMKRMLLIGVGLFLFFVNVGFVSLESPNVLFSGDTNYYHAKVLDFDLQGIPMRGLFLDVDAQGMMAPVVHPQIYTDTSYLFENLVPHVQNTLLLGGGAYTLPKKFADQYSGAQIDVLEIDPQVTQLAQEFFDLGEYSNITTFHQDPRWFLKQKDRGSYEIVFGDVYNSFISIPWHLITQEAHEEVYNVLEDDGVYALAFISSLEGPGEQFTASMVKTFSEVFPVNSLMVFSENSTVVGNMILFGRKSNEQDMLTQDLYTALDDVINEYPQLSVWQDYFGYSVNLDRGIIFTDDDAPVEGLMKDIVDAHYGEYMNVYRFFIG